MASVSKHFAGAAGLAGFGARTFFGGAVAILLWAWGALQGYEVHAQEPDVLARVDIVTPVTDLELPAYAHLRDASGTEYALVVATETQLRRQGWHYVTIEPAAAPEHYLVAQPVRAGARVAAAGRFQVVYDDGVQTVIRATADDADALGALGFALQRLPAAPIIWTRFGVGVPEKRATQEFSGAAGYDARVAAIMDNVRIGPLMTRVKRLAGDEPAIAAGDLYSIQTRYTGTGIPTPIGKATQAAYDHFEALGLAPAFHNWSNGGRTCRNVIGTQWGTLRSNEIVIVVAHLDSVPGSGLAPGADDNGSGSAALLLAAELLRPYRFDRTLRYLLVTGEEQGLLGSAVYAQAALAAGDNIVAVYNMDMIAWDGPAPPLFQLHIRTTSNPTGHALDLAIAEVFVDVVAQYGLSASLTPVIKPDAMGYSDHKSFWDRGYPGLCAIEDYGSDFNPYYHTAQDSVANMNQNYFLAAAKASIGTTAHLAEPVGQSPFSLVEVALSDWSPGSGIGCSVLLAGRAEGATAEGADGHDLAWSGAPANPNPKWLKIATTPDGTALRKDARPLAFTSVFHATLSAVDTVGGGVSCSNRLRFAFLPAPESNCVYTATIRVDGPYTADSNDFVCVTNVATVVGDNGYGYVELPRIAGVPNGAIYGTVDLVVRRTGSPGTVMMLR